MPEFTSHKPGTFSWADLSTSDLDAATKLYTDIFGWEAVSEDIPDGGVYVMFRLNGKDVAAASGLQTPDMPPHWNVYFTVEDAEQAAKTAESIGGTIVAPAFDVMEFGRMSVCADPTGAVFSLWEPKTNIGAQIMGEVGTLSWAEVLTNDVDKAGRFYTELFDCTLTPFGPDGSYKVLTRGDEQLCGLMKSPDPSMQPNWLIYFTVEDVDATVGKIKAAGGQAYMEPTDMPEVGRISVIADAQGAAFGVIGNQPTS